ncbi:pantetheine-phosphate adenylyltransferase [Oenococcus oeni]|uniref:Phosphopantetheine adenylyltransferase n=1 Tax=Oenococcus oeni TaxID=1247 RepID=A0A483B8B1_OENOE|nr:pantetheine-phosphate adenylyltransferase [Oenococcus oeni]AVI94442.1 phosphopantetheine adenylyltransferase [Oenococcus oeni]EJO02552.1 phosphopantetheine adenylyltransferase [Oenococcus oeni AWRIB418]KDP19544.1 phosphopantetheine adenylyltransferase [Oenococcus oeni]KEP88479.1 phosphopantetheine adenylyltransferase [Oenococcus oeni IOEB_0501]KGH60182.1 phosphopantetheine adenylyltransferase [Oenococcus oeni IOEB_9805]
MVKAVFPGSFDPLTFGHLDVISRSALLFDQVIVAVGINTSKTAMFTTEEKITLISNNTKNLKNVSVLPMPGLTFKFVSSVGADVIVRGIRNVRDYEYERDIAEINHRLGNVDTVLLPSKAVYQDISSSNLKEVAKFGADISHFVPENVIKLIKLKTK